MALAPDSKDFDPEDVDMSTYEDRFERQQQQQQLEQNDGTKSLHQKSGAGRTDSVAREGTRDTSSKPQSTENWCKQYAAEPRCQANNYCTTNNLCTNTTRVEPSSTRGQQHLRPWVPSGITRVEPSNTREGPSDSRGGTEQLHHKSNKPSSPGEKHSNTA